MLVLFKSISFDCLWIQVFFKAGLLGTLEEMRDEKTGRSGYNDSGSLPWLPDEEGVCEDDGEEVRNVMNKDNINNTCVNGK